MELGYIHVTEFDAVQIEDALRVCQNERIQGQDLEHLQGCHQSTAPLLHHVADWGGREGGVG